MSDDANSWHSAQPDVIVFLEDRRVHLVGRVAARVADAADADEADVAAGDARVSRRVRLLTSSARGDTG